MATKLYPPVINGTIPAFCTDTDGTTNLVVPFAMNRGVSWSDLKGFKLIIKNLHGKILCSLMNTDIETIKQNGYAIFDLALTDSAITYKDSFIIGQYYRVQLAYIDTSNIVGYYSTIGVTKYTSLPTIIIEELSENNTKNTVINPNHKFFTGSCIQSADGDCTEKMYSYRFRIIDIEDDTIYEDTGELLHDIINDTDSRSQVETFYPQKPLVDGKKYSIQFFVYTTNHLLLASSQEEYLSSPKYYIQNMILVPSTANIELNPELNFEEGYITLKFSSNDSNKIFLSGYFVIARASSEDNYTVWQDIYTNEINAIKIKDWYLKDFTIQQGISYKYSFQQYNKHGVYAERICSDAIYADYEDAFLFDGKKQLKIRFNPKISTYKTDLLESKLETLGSQYPFFTRGGTVNYKEFAISGLISYQMDSANLFIDLEDLGISEKTGYRYVSQSNGEYIALYQAYLEKAKNASSRIERSSFLKLAEQAQKNTAYSTLSAETYLDPENTLSGENFYAERIFKNKVLDWLNNGEVKLLRTPSEGSFLVRLMNVSLSPTDSLSRMIHTFTATAYEVAEYSINMLLEYSLFESAVAEIIPMYDFTTIDLSTVEKSTSSTFTKLNFMAAIHSCLFTDMIPGTLINIIYNGSQNSASISIGVTGTYRMDNCSNISSISISNSGLTGFCTYSYETTNSNVIYNSDLDTINFNNIVSYNTIDVPLAQYVGKSYKGTNGKNENLLSYLVSSTDTQIETIAEYYSFTFYKKDIHELYIKADCDLNNPVYYTSIKCDTKYTISESDLLTIFYIRQLNENLNNDNIFNSQYYIDSNLDSYSHYITNENGAIKALDVYSNSFVFINNDSFNIQIDDETINVLDSGSLHFTQIKPETIIPEIGVITELSYSKQVLVYEQ